MPPPWPGKSWPLGGDRQVPGCRGRALQGLGPHSPPPPPRHQRVRAGGHRVWAWPAVLQHPRQLPVCGHALSPRLPPGLQPRVRAAAPPPGRGLGAAALPPGRPPRPRGHPLRSPRQGHTGAGSLVRGAGWRAHSTGAAGTHGHSGPPQPRDPGAQASHPHCSGQTPGPGVRSPCGWERSLGRVPCPAPSRTREPGLGAAVRAPAPAFEPRPTHCKPGAAEPPGRGHGKGRWREPVPTGSSTSRAASTSVC